MRFTSRMGREKARKPKKQRLVVDSSRTDLLTQYFSSLHTDALWTSLFAAGTSPAARHRSASVGSALAAALRAQSLSRPDKALPPVQELVDRAAKVAGISGMQEDFVPKDPTESVTVRVGDELRLFIPGSTERPIADLSRALRLSQALDPFLVRRHGFGLKNVIRVLYNWADAASRALLPSMTPAPGVALGDNFTIPSIEIAAAQRLASVDPLTMFHLSGPDAAALEWMTTSSDKAHFDLTSRDSPFGRYLRYRSPLPGQADRWLPPTFVPEILCNSVSELVSTLDRDHDARVALRASCLREARKALWRFSDTLLESPPGKTEENVLTGQDIQWIVPVTPTAAIAVSLVLVQDLMDRQDLMTSAISFASVRLARRVSKTTGSTTARLAGGGRVTLAPGAQIIPLVIVAGSSHISATQHKGFATLALEDLTWIAESADDDDDLYLFTRDLSDPEFPDSVGWEAINYWEPWRANGKTFFKGGIEYSVMHFEAHAGDVEWEKAHRSSALEIALHGTGLQALRDAQRFEISPEGIASVTFLDDHGSYDLETGLYHSPPLYGWSLALTTPPVAMLRSDPRWYPRESYDFLFDLCGGLAYAFDAVAEEWEKAHDGLQAPGYKLEIAARDPERASDSADGSIVSIEVLDRVGPQDTYLVRWTIDVDRFAEAADGDPFAANRLTALHEPGCRTGLKPPDSSRDRAM